MQRHNPILPGRSQRLVAGGDASPTRLWCGPLACTNIQQYSVNGNCQPNLQIAAIQQTSTSEFGFIRVNSRCALDRDQASSGGLVAVAPFAVAQSGDAVMSQPARFHPGPRVSLHVTYCGSRCSYRRSQGK